MRLRALGLAFAGTLLIAAQAVADGPLNFTYRDVSGNVHDCHFEGQGWRGLQLNNGGMTGAPPALYDPAAFTPGDLSLFTRIYSRLEVAADHRDFTYVGEKGDIHRIHHEGGRWRHEVLNNAGTTNAPPAAGRVSGLLFGLGHLLYTYRDRDGNIQQIHRQNGRWKAYRLNNGGSTPAPLAAGDPVVLEWGAGRCEVVYRDPAGGLQRLHWRNGAWKAEQLNCGGATQAPAAAGQPQVLEYKDNCLATVYRDISGNLHLIQRTRSGLTHAQLNGGGLTPGPAAAGDPACAARKGHMHYVYRDRAGAIQHIHRQTGRWRWLCEKLNDGGLCDAPEADGDPRARFTPGPEGEALLNVFYADALGNLVRLKGLQGMWSFELVNTGAHVTMPLPAGPISFY